MSESESGTEDDGVAGRREVAHRLFAAEFDDADFSYSESDEERAPNYVVTPTGARVNRLFVVGVLTEIESVNDEVLRARVVDPTGPFVVYAGQYQPDELAFLEAAEPPLFVAVTGKARTFQPDDSDRVYTSVRPESISQVDADTRDRWVVQAAEQTIDRVGQMAGAKQTGLSGDELRTALEAEGVAESLAAGIPLALEHYGTTGDYLDAVREMSLDAARVVAGEIDEASPVSLSPGDGGDDPIPVLASTDIDADVGTPDTSADEGTVPSAEESLTTDVSEDRAAAGTAAESETQNADSTVDDEADAGDTDPVEEPVPTTDADPVTEDADPEPSEPETAETTTETAESETAETAQTDTTADSAQTTAPESDTETESDSLVETADAGAPTDSDDGDIGDFDPEFELDEEEREEIESEYGTDFQSGTEVGEAGEAGIETPDPEDLDAATEPEEPTAETDAEAEPAADDTATEAESESATTADEDAAEDVDLEDAVMDVMAELDDGGGADREEIQAAVVDRHGADPGAVDDAIQDALMGGRCYEPEDGKLTPI